MICMIWETRQPRAGFCTKKVVAIFQSRAPVPARFRGRGAAAMRTIYGAAGAAWSFDAYALNSVSSASRLGKREPNPFPSAESKRFPLLSASKNIPNPRLSTPLKNRASFSDSE